MGGEICPDLEFNPSLTIRHGNTEFRLYASLNSKTGVSEVCTD